MLCGSLKVLFHLCDLELSDVARKSWVLRRSVLAVVVIYVPSEFFGSFLGHVGGLLSLFGLVVVYSGVGRLLLVSGGYLFTIWVVFPLQTDVAARVLLLGCIFLLICVCVASSFLVRWFGNVVFGFNLAVLLLCLLNCGVAVVGVGVVMHGWWW